MSGNVQRKSMDSASIEHLRSFIKEADLADDIPVKNESSRVDLLIGNDYYLDIVLSQRIELQPGLYLLASKVGWIITGRNNEEHYKDNSESSLLILTYGNNITNSNVFTSVDSRVPTKPDLEDFWNVETIGIKDHEQNDNERAKTLFQESLRFEEGRYQVKWPWKDENPELPVNRDLAMGRLRSTVSRIQNSPNLMAQYNSVIRDQLDKGIIEKVPNSENGSP